MLKIRISFVPASIGRESCNNYACTLFAHKKRGTDPHLFPNKFELWRAWRSPASLFTRRACGCHKIDHLKETCSNKQIKKDSSAGASLPASLLPTAKGRAAHGNALSTSKKRAEQTQNRESSWQAYNSPASLRVSPCQYRRRVDCTNFSTSRALSITVLKV